MVIINPLKILNIAAFLQYQRFLMPISFLFYLYNGLTFSDYIFCQSMFNGTCLLAKLSLSFIGDIFSKKYIIVIAYLMSLLRVILWINFSGFWVVLSGEILYGFFKAFYRGNIDSYVYEWLQKKNITEEMSTRYGKLSFYTSLGSATSCLMGALLYKFFGFKIILYLELVAQILAISCLFMLPNIRGVKDKSIKISYRIKSVFNNIKNLFKNTKINYYVYYSAMLIGYSDIFVWNFQPAMKAASTPVFCYGIITFCNQFFRAIAGLRVNSFLKKFQGNKLVSIEFAAILISLFLIFSSYLSKNSLIVLPALLVICYAIHLFMMFNISTVTRIHENTPDSVRATMSSTNSFVENFTSFILLLIFKFLYDKFGLYNTLFTFAIGALILFYPHNKIIRKNV